MRSIGQWRTSWRGIALVLVLLALLTLAACEDEGAPSRPVGDDGGMPEPFSCEVRAPTECVDPNLSYDEVQPIIERRCLSCHDGRAEQWPLLDYAHVASWFIEIRSAMLSCAMP